MGSLFSNPHAVFVEIDDVITKSDDKNNLEITNPGMHDFPGDGASGIDGCEMYRVDIGDGKGLQPWKYSGGDTKLDLGLFQTSGRCSGKILDNEKYFSSCFLVPRNLKVKDYDGTDISDKCKLVYKTELKCEGDDTEETVEESFTNFKNDNDKSCIFLAAIIVVVYLYIKRKN